MTARAALRRAIVLLCAVAVVTTACVPFDAAESPGGWTVPGPSTDATAAVAALPVERLAPSSSSRAADDIPPPTNRWYSGLVFGAEPQRIYPFPLALRATADSFGVSLPTPSVTATSIEAADTGGVAVAVDADAFEVVRADPVSVTVRYSREGNPVGDLTTAEGWPVIAFTAAEDTTLTAGLDLHPTATDTWAVDVGGQEYAVTAPGATAAGAALRLPAGATAQWFAVPSDSDVAAWADALGGPVTSVSTSFSAQGDTSSTRLTYDAADATVLVPFPGREPDEPCELGTFETVYGTATACATSSLTWAVPRVAPAGDYDFDRLDDATRAALATQIAEDLAATVPAPADTYFGGKALARLGTLLSLAESIGDSALADRIADRLEEELGPWLDPAGCLSRDERCFVYDDALRLVVGRTPSFGSEEGNDHHFHYGYFLSAAAALAAARPDRVDVLAPVMDALAADIAAGASDGSLPGLRVFDPYRGHSWASGQSPFASGNNQESSSEAVAAWNALALWADARGDEGLAATAEWMLSAEASAARSLWLEPDDLPAGYDHGIVSLTWGGKRDYATWFSAEPSAILGIQVLPVGPVSLEYLAGSPERVAANVAEAGGAAAYTQPLGDSVLMYSALGGGAALDAAEEAASRLSDDHLDDGSSRSAMLAWLAAVRLNGGGAGP